VAGDTDHLDTFGLDGGCQRTNPQARGVLGTIVFVDDENGEAEFHAGAPGRGKTEASVLRVSDRRWTNCRPATGGNQKQNCRPLCKQVQAGTGTGLRGCAAARPPSLSYGVRPPVGDGAHIVLEELEQALC